MRSKNRMTKKIMRFFPKVFCVTSGVVYGLFSCGAESRQLGGLTSSGVHPGDKFALFTWARSCPIKVQEQADGMQPQTKQCQSPGVLHTTSALHCVVKCVHRGSYFTVHVPTVTQCERHPLLKPVVPHHSAAAWEIDLH